MTWPAVFANLARQERGHVPNGSFASFSSRARQVRLSSETRRESRRGWTGSLGHELLCVPAANCFSTCSVFAEFETILRRERQMEGVARAKADKSQRYLCRQEPPRLDRGGWMREMKA
jgi:hypothetical protein